ncbi:hypothetical protein [Paracoccus laeviglucosivorans]|nr:hypothetical protein [Paracoccus laeviglucosivorans]
MTAPPTGANDMERVTFMIGDTGPFEGSAFPISAAQIASVEFGGLDFQDQTLFRGVVCVSYADGTSISGNIHSMSFARMADGMTGKIDFSRVAIPAIGGALE